MIGEDSVPAGTGCDHTTRPVRIDRATNWPPPGLLPCTDRTGITISWSVPSTAGEAAASVPTLCRHSARPVEVRIAVATPSSPSMNIVPCQITGGNSSSAPASKDQPRCRGV